MAQMVRAPFRHILLVACALAVPADGVGCDLDLAGPKGDRVFFALGMRFEHPGRHAAAQNTLFDSASLAPRLDRCYAKGASSLDVALFAQAGSSGAIDRRRALAYVAGVWARHRHDGAILLTAGTSKADLVATLLKALGCANV